MGRVSELRAVLCLGLAAAACRSPEPALRAHPPTPVLTDAALPGADGPTAVTPRLDDAGTPPLQPPLPDAAGMVGKPTDPPDASPTVDATVATRPDLSPPPADVLVAARRIDPILSFERGTTELDVAPGRGGRLFTANDGASTGTQTPPGPTSLPAVPVCDTTPCPDPAPPDSRFAFHIEARGYSGWGSLVGTDLAFLYVGNLPSRSSVNASTFTGVTFWARTGPGATTAHDRTVRFGVHDANSDPDGGRCVPDGTATTACWNDWGTELTIPATWTRFFIPFASLRQGTWGMRGTAITTDRLFQLQWRSGPNARVDLWIDDVAFYGD